MKDFKYFMYTIAIASMVLLAIDDAFGQTGKYQRPGKKAAAEVAPAPGTAAPATPAPADSKAKPDGKSEKMDIQEIESAYWQQKDSEFHVVQNRRFSKEKRFFVSPTVGILINDSFTKGQAYGLSGGYYMNERNGVELSYLQYDVKKSKSTSEIFGLNGAPAYNSIQSQLTATYNWMPIYGKISLFDSSIIYFDMGINAGLGLVQYEKNLDTGTPGESAVMVVLDITQQFFVSENFAIRFDVRNRLYKEDREKYQIKAPATTRDAKSEFTHSMSAALGFVYYFGSGKQD